MKLNFKVLIAGLVIIGGVNAIALIGVAYNRLGVPDAVVDLTERELDMHGNYDWQKENTGLALTFRCRMGREMYGYVTNNCRGRPDWLDQEKLAELGFEVEPPSKTYEELLIRHRPKTRNLYLVLEYNGDSYQEALAKAEQALAEAKVQAQQNPNEQRFKNSLDRARSNLVNEQRHNSRLFAIDAGQDVTTLRNKYSNANRYIIIPALVKTVRRYAYQGNWAGTVTGPLIKTINIPLEYRAVFTAVEEDKHRPGYSKHGPRYKVRVAFGKRAEPWVMGVERL